MTRKQTVGVVMGVAGVVISFGHLALMMIFRTTEPYHGFLTWTMLGLALTVVGLLLLAKSEPR
ncbi:MAG: hypothetical protein H0V18_08135 [Pyrinomonadaceae bacterium]|nr:hypothetical protein [Pyrinomonadaceae bacterium]